MYGVTTSVLYIKKLPLLLFRSNLGNNVERVWVVFVKVPVVWVIPFVSVGEYLNSLSFVISDTMKVPLKPLSSIPEVLNVLCTFLTIIWSPTPKLWGLSERISTSCSVESKLACDINLVLRSKA